MRTGNSFHRFRIGRFDVLVMLIITTSMPSALQRAPCPPARFS
jgi:hypothetical protein